MINLRDDKELCALFKSESDERLQQIEQGLLRLESDPGHRETLEALFRDVHTLKGSAGMVGASDIQAMAHRMEDLLGGARRGERPLSPESIAKLYRAVDVVARLVEEAVTGEPSGVDVWKAMTELRQESAAPPTFSSPAPEASAPIGADTSMSESAGSGASVSGAPEVSAPAPSISAAPGASTSVASERAASPASDVTAAAVTAAGRGREIPVGERIDPEEAASEAVADAGGSADPAMLPRGLQIETIRVDAAKLDALMTHAGELAVTRTRLARRGDEIDVLIGQWEEQMRELETKRVALKELRAADRAGAAGRRQAAIERLNQLHDRMAGMFERLGDGLEKIRSGIAEESARLDFLSDELGEGIRSARLLPMSTLFNLFPRMVRQLARDQGKDVTLVIEGQETTADKRIIEELKDPLMHMLRNAVDHGIEPPETRREQGKRAVGELRVRAYKTASNTVVEVSDDGAGLDLEVIGRAAAARGVATREEIARMTPSQIRALIFTPGFSTRAMITDVSGRGVGMDVVRANVERLKGTITIISTPGTGTTIRIELPATLATARMMVLSVGGHPFALPVESIHASFLVSSEAVHLVEGRETIMLSGRPISIAPLAELLELGGGPARHLDGRRSDGRHDGRREAPCVVLKEGDDLFGLLVDDLVDELELVLKPETGVLRRVRNVAGSAILGSGRVCVILNPHDLARSIRRRSAPQPTLASDGADNQRRTILLVEDSITTRTQMKRILEGAGYEVVTAVDGLDGFSRLGARRFDAVVSDVQMPNMDGLGLTAAIRGDARHASLPVILVTSLAREEDKRRGIEVGANAYLTKPTFDQKVLLDTLRRLV